MEVEPLMEMEETQTVEHVPQKAKFRRKNRSVLALGSVFLLYALAMAAIAYFRGFEQADAEDYYNSEAGGRMKRSADEGVSAAPHEFNPHEWGNCTPRSVEEFPPDFMSIETKRGGGIAFHVFVAIYIFAALAVVCDDYFVSSLEKLSDVLKLQPDVAGATFMAAGSSAPELFTSIIGVFFAKSDVGTGTIVGSAVFNILFIIAICGLFAGMVIKLTWWPLVRDCLYYTLSVVVLVVVIVDETVYWYEAAVMTVLYVLYIVLMKFNPKLGEYFTKKFDGKACCKNAAKKDIEMGKDKNQNGVTYESKDMADGQKKAEEEEFESPLTFPKGLRQRLQWIVMLPCTLVFIITIPDCRRPGCWQKLWAISFINSVIWIAVLSYIMVWMVCIIGDTMGIPDTVMGLTLLAAGTSVPDALASLMVARDGYGDMAVSNSIGSNVFDILLCLGLPWLIQTLAFSPDKVMHINSSGLVYCALTLLGTVVFLLTAVAINKWRLNKIMGIICLVVYAIVITISCLYELNVFGQLNPPPCPRMTGYT